MRLRAGRGAQGAAQLPAATQPKDKEETETETETETEAEGYLADEHPSRSGEDPGSQGSGQRTRMRQTPSDSEESDPQNRRPSPGAPSTRQGSGRVLSPVSAGVRRRTRVDPHENFENLQETSKWFPDAYKAPNPGEESKEVLDTRKRREFWIRTRLTFAMFLSFLFLIASGQFFVMLLVIAIKVGMFREVLALKRNREKDTRIPLFRSLNWYFFVVCIYFTYGMILQHRISVVHLEMGYVGILTDHHLFKSFILWVIGFMAFILCLEKGSYKYQFTQFSWTHMTLLMVVVSASCMINNMYGGMVWFYLPVCLVIWNDVYAYVFGRFYGKTPLIKLSPKKTWEGFLGAFLTTVVFGWWGGYLLSFFPNMICAQEELTITPFPQMNCVPDPIFVPSVPFKVPAWLRALSLLIPREEVHLGETALIMPWMLHVTGLSIFCGIVAPFGGFFASGFKRAFKIKDFGDLIPGHGGITDRMDCQIIMSVFVAVYRATFITGLKRVTVARILSQVDRLSATDQLELLARLQAAIGSPS